MWLNNVRLIGESAGMNIRVKDDSIAAVTNQNATGKDRQLFFDNALAFPGLINSHDHLDFNLFPRLGDKVYANYTEWGRHIHQTYKDEISRVLQIPLTVREEWGVLKNLLCGVTAVVNHGSPVKLTRPLIHVHQNCYSLHSTAFEKNWRLKLNNPLKKRWPYVIHTGEGTDDFSRNEIDSLIRWNISRKKLIGVHGVAMTKEQAKRMRALVWCPQSNQYLLGKHAAIDQLKSATKILFGTDSTLTGHWNIWEHIRDARTLKMLTDDELYHSLTTRAARLWQLNTGKIATNKTADIVIVKTKPGGTDMAAFFNTRPADILLVMQGGSIKLLDEELFPQLKTNARYSRVYVDGACKYIRADVPALFKNIREHYPGISLPAEADE